MLIVISGIGVTMFAGRSIELKELNNRFEDDKSHLVVVYGRRRIGKNELLEQFSKNKTSLKFEGLEKQSQKKQLEYFVQRYADQSQNSLLKSLKLTKWHEALDLITQMLFTLLKNLDLQMR